VTSLAAHPTLQDIMLKAYKTYEETHRLPYHVRKAARALMICRTSVLGGHVEACPQGDYHRQWYNSCRHRMCPQCNWIRIGQWLEKQKERLLPCGHYHMIFTLPHELNDLWLLNVKSMTHLLFTCVRDTLCEFFLDPKHLGAKPGIIATLHTWSQTMVLHPHLHCLITEGGLDDTRWVTTRHNGFLLPVRAVMAVFRGKFLASLNTAIEKGMITLPAGMTMRQWTNLKNKLGRTKWNVHIRERYDHGRGILIYLSRYIRGGAISNRRITSSADEKVAFTHRASEGRDTITLPVAEFIKRYLLHVPAPHTKIVRYYGIYATTAHKQLSLCRSSLHPVESEDIAWSSTRPDYPNRCPVCGCLLVRIMDPPREKEVIPHAA